MEINRREDSINSERALQAHMQYMEQQQINMQQVQQQQINIQQQLQQQLQRIEVGRGRRRSPSEESHDN